MVRHILYLEDTKISITLTEVFLQDTLPFEFKFYSAHDRASFLKILDEQKFDLLISDYHLADINGYEALEIFRKREKSVPFIIFTTAVGDEKHAFELFKKGADDFILKNKKDLLPISICKLLREYDLKTMMMQTITNQKNELAEANLNLREAMLKKSEFFACMTHEIRTPLNSILGLSDILIEMETDLEKLNYAKTIKNSSECLLRVVNDILDISQFEANKIGLFSTQFNLRELITSTFNILKIKSEQKNLRFVLNMPDDLPRDVLGDHQRFRQLLMNLMRNAIKYTPKGSVEVDVEIIKSEQSQANVEITIRDTGIGIPSDKMPFIFDLYTRIKSKKKITEGAGLGLSIAKQIVDLMHGEIKIESIEGTGTSVFLNIPFKVIEVNEANNRVLLIVDDDTAILDTLTKIFSSTEMSVVQKLDANDAFEYLIKNSVDLVISDYKMPKSSGADFFKNIRNLKLNTPFILLSGFWNDTDESLGKGFQYVEKPWDINDIIDFVTPLVEKGKKGRQNDGILKELAFYEAVNILIVDDTIENHILLKAYLKSTFDNYVSVMNGEQAVEKAMTKHFEIIFMDINMPGIDGFETIKRIRALEKEHNKKRSTIITLTAQGTENYRIKSKLAGSDNFLLKPITKSDYLKEILQVKNTHYKKDRKYLDQRLIKKTDKE